MNKKIEFKELPLNDKLQLAVIEAGYLRPTDIQIKVIPPVVAGNDIIAAAPTGSGKSAAYLLPIIQKIIDNKKNTTQGNIRALILLPTRELVIQTRDFILQFGAHLDISAASLFGGVGISPQIQSLRAGVDIAIATPGRLLELLERKDVFFNNLNFLVLDEIDRMLQMGFRQDISAIARKLPPLTQSLFFSATISTDTAKLAGRILQNPIQIDLQRKEESLKLPKNITFNTLFVDKGRKRKLLKWLLEEINYNKVLIFVNSKPEADRLDRDLRVAEIPHTTIHGDKGNSERTRAIEKFNNGGVKVLVATDIAARGFDPKELSHVIHYTVPTDVDTFFHRSGRTGRAGAKGDVFIFCDQFDRNRLNRITEEIDGEINHFPWQPFHSDKIEFMSPEDALEKEKLERSRKLDKLIKKEEDREPEEKSDNPHTPKKKNLKPARRKNGMKTKPKRSMITGKGRQKKNRPSNAVQINRGKRH